MNSEYAIEIRNLNKHIYTCIFIYDMYCSVKIYTGNCIVTYCYQTLQGILPCHDVMLRIAVFH